MRIIFVVLIALVVNGCATTEHSATQHYGNYMPDELGSIEVRIAHDALDQLLKLYPPAKNRFNMQHEANELFGMTLIKNMRHEGYAVNEFNRTSAPQSTKETLGLSLSYILDTAGAPDIYRLTLIVGSQSISRPYMRQGTKVVPAGY